MKFRQRLWPISSPHNSVEAMPRSGRVTADSFLQHNPGIPSACCCDEEQGCLDPACEPFRALNSTNSGSRTAPIPFPVHRMELSYACTPYLIDHLLDEGFDGVVFLKQETLVLDSLFPLFDASSGIRFC